MQERLSGAGPSARTGRRCRARTARPWKGRNKPRRQDRRWARAWSPEQISNRLRVDFPDDESMRISHEAIYQALYVQSRGALKRELVACLRTGRALRVPEGSRRSRGKNFVSDEIMISERPAEARGPGGPGALGRRSDPRDSATPRSGRWWSARARFTMLLHLPPPEVRQPEAQERAAGHRARRRGRFVTRSPTRSPRCPEQLRRSLTWDQGAEMAEHAKLRIDTGLQVYFCDPQSPWQRGTNENTNGLLRQYFPRGHRPRQTHRRGPRRGRRRTQRPTTKDTRLDDTPAEALDRPPRHRRHDAARRRARGYRRSGTRSARAYATVRDDPSGGDTHFRRGGHYPIAAAREADSAMRKITGAASRGGEHAGAARTRCRAEAERRVPVTSGELFAGHALDARRTDKSRAGRRSSQESAIALR